MDVFYLATVGGFLLATLGLVKLCVALRGDR